MANDGFYRTALIGGAPAAVDGVDGDDVADKDLILAMVSNVLYVYEVDADSAAAESSPDVIAFDANGGDKRAVLKAALAGTGASRFPGEIAVIGGQIAFPATAAPSADANTLDDYEEGTWSPAYTNTTPPATPYTTEVVGATYTKTGRQVAITAFIRTDNVDVTGAAGNLIISGLPFTCAANGQTAISIAEALLWGGDYPGGGYTETSGTNITLNKRVASNGTFSYMDAADLTAGATGNQNLLIFSITYFI